MTKNYNKIIKNKLFHNISEENFSSMLNCLSSFERSYGKNESIVNEGDPINFVGAVLEGSVKITRTDYDGNMVILAEVSEGDIFAEVFACAQISKCPVSIVSTTESRVLFFDYYKIITTCSASCIFHQQLIANMLNIVAQKSLYLNNRLNIISKKSLRNKLLTYFQYASMGQARFTIPMNREELAHFICADRSALSNELSKMKKEGLLDYHKNTFTLYLH